MMIQTKQRGSQEVSSKGQGVLWNSSELSSNVMLQAGKRSAE